MEEAKEIFDDDDQEMMNSPKIIQAFTTEIGKKKNKRRGEKRRSKRNTRRCRLGNVHKWKNAEFLMK